MKFDNFNTGRCAVCGTIKQYQPGKEYQPSDFECKCNATVEQPEKPEIKEVLQEVAIDSEFDAMMTEAKGRGIRVPHNISKEKLAERLEEANDGDSGPTT